MHDLRQYPLWVYNLPMNFVSKLGYGLLLLAVTLTQFNPLSAYAHSNNNQEAYRYQSHLKASNTAHATPDCASICSQNSQAQSSPHVAKEIKRKDEKRPLPVVILAFLEPHHPNKLPPTSLNSTVRTNIYKLLESYLFYDY